MRAVIISGGTIKNYSYIQSHILPNDLIVCADSGYWHAQKMNLTPVMVLGDFDSLGFVPNDVPTQTFSFKKNVTDTEIALDYARQKGASSFLFLACTGTRLDHTLSNIFLLQDCLKRNEPAEILDEYNKIRLINTHCMLNEPQGSLVSLVPLTICHGVTTAHLAYPLLDATLFPEKSLGISNVMTESSAAVSLKDGLLLVCIARDEAL